jgi:transcriptional regulator with XRE-family HTH domain
MQRFGQKMRALRTQHGMTIRELAAALPYKGASRISEIETGKRIPTADFVFKVAKLFNVTTDQLLDDTLDIPGMSAADTPNEESEAAE